MKIVQKLKKKFQEMHNILAEMEAARENMSSVISEIDSLDNRYMRAELEYKEYSKIKNKILSGRTKELA